MNDINKVKILGNNMRILRRLYDVEAKELSEHMGVSRQTYFSYENGNTKMAFDDFMFICDYYHIDPKDMLREDLKIIINANSNSISFE